jgi:hypothetical protein
MNKIFTLAVIFLAFIFSNNILSAQNALDFDGVDDVVQTNFAGIQGSSPRSIEAWIKTTVNAVPTAGGIQQTIVDWGMFSGQGNRFTFNLLWGNAIRLEVGGNGVSGTIPVNDGEWHHVAVTFDPAATDQIRLYVDGQLDVAGTTTVPVDTDADVNVQIGKRIDDANSFTGSIDEVRIWDIALDQGQIQNNMNKELCTPPDNLVAYYIFNQGVANQDNTGETTVFDISGNGYDGTLIDFNLAGDVSNWVAGSEVTPGIVTVNESISACDSLTWDGMTYTQSGTYTTMITGINGCDTVKSLDLNIISVTTTVVEDPDEPVLFPSAIDADNYQWLNCNDNFAIIANENQPTFTALESGNYAVEITQGGCVDTSTCFIIEIVGLESLKKQETISLYPNPTQGEFSIDLKKNQHEATIKIYDISGKKIREQIFKNSNLIKYQLEGNQGLYFVVVEIEGEILGRFKIIKE